MMKTNLLFNQIFNNVVLIPKLMLLNLVTVNLELSWATENILLLCGWAYNNVQLQRNLLCMAFGC